MYSDDCICKSNNFIQCKPNNKEFAYDMKDEIIS